MSQKNLADTLEKPLKGRGAVNNPEGRFETILREAVDDGWDTPAQPEDASIEVAFKTITTQEIARTIISRNDSPDIGFSQSINPYRGCEHGCIYCYARPSHAYLNLSPGLDFETRLFAKANAAALLRAELAKPGYRCEPIVLGANTDPYQPIERTWKITRQILEVLAECQHPVCIISKAALVERDLDLLAAMAEKNLVHVHISITTLDATLARHMEPRAAAPARRLATLRALSAAGVPNGVMVAPVIPFLTDAEMEHILETAQEAGAISAGYVLMRLPYELKDLFKDWLQAHYPLKAAHVMSRVRQMREGKENDPNFGSRMRGSGLFAELLGQRFHNACARLGFNPQRQALSTAHFRRPELHGQMSLF
ncbi:MAG: PA0069 family radical SAM protein [Gallionellaceae bacterium]|nr:PA0069 family radical SAM protein [Gallionellaceae bacterium]